MTDQQDTLARLDQLLMRVLDGEASPSEHQELLSLPDQAVQLAALRGFSEVLVDAVRTAAGDEPQLAEPVLQALGRDDGWAAIAGALQSSVAAPIELADGVMAALGLEDAVSEAFAGLRGLAAEPVDVAEGVMAAILGEAPAAAPVAAADLLETASPEAWISALHDGELPIQERLRIAAELPGDRAALSEISAYAELGRLVRSTLQAEDRKAQLDGVWAAVADGIGLEGPEHVPGWEPVGEALRHAVAARGVLTAGQERELADHVMAALPQPKPEPAALELAPDPSAGPVSVSWWQGLFLPALAMVSAAVLLVTFVQTGSGVVPVAPGGDPGTTVYQEEAFELASANDAELEDFVSSDGVTLQVLQSEGGGPMILMIEEVSPDQLAEDAGWDDIEWEEL